MENVILHVYYTCKSGMAEPFVRALKESGLQQTVLEEDGCLQYDYAISCEKPDTVVLLEKWRDKEALKKHAAQPHMAQISAMKNDYVDDVKLERYQ